MRLTITFALAALLLTACVTPHLQRGAKGQSTLATMRADGAHVGSPIALADIERGLLNDRERLFQQGSLLPSAVVKDLGPRWGDFKSKVRAGDVLRPYSHSRGGEGFVLLRNDSVVDIFFTVIY
jgi:hypothetical protein